jgi:hypothetical protein
MAGMDDEPSDEDREAWSAELEHLRQEHRDLDAAIEPGSRLPRQVPSSIPADPR